MPANDCQLNEMFENYYRYLKINYSNQDFGSEVINAFEMSQVLAVLLNVSKEEIMEKYINWYNTYKK